MMETSVLSENSLAIIRSDSFVKEAKYFLRKALDQKEVAIQMTDEDILKKHAAKFCRHHLTKFFPATDVTRAPDTDLVVEEVLQTYKILRAQLLNKSPSQSCFTGPSIEESPRFLNSDRTEVCSREFQRAAFRRPSSSWRQGRRQECLQKSWPRNYSKSSSKTGSLSVASGETKAIPAIGHTHNGVSEVSQGDLYRLNDLRTSVHHPEQQGQQPTVVGRTEVERTTQPVMKIHEFQEALEIPAEIASLKHEIHSLQLEVQALKAHRTFVETTLQVCQDTYLAEAQSANNVGIHERASQCNAIVSVLRDLRIDLNFQYFHDYTNNYGHAPPSNCWLDGSRMMRQQYHILRS